MAFNSKLWFKNWVMVVLATTEFDCIIWGDTSGWASQWWATIFIAHPIGRCLVLSLHRVRESIVDEAHATTPIWNVLEIGFSIQWLACQRGDRGCKELEMWTRINSKWIEGMTVKWTHYWSQLKLMNDFIDNFLNFILLFVRFFRFCIVFQTIFMKF